MARILVVSPDKAVRKALLRLVTRRGHEGGSSGAAAPQVETRLGEAWDAAFIDVSATCSEGLAAVSIARQSAPALPIAAIDSGGDGAGLNRLAGAVRLGAVEFVRMPIDRIDAAALMTRLNL
jgi:DNA-binding NtrC family response regulator